MLKGIIACETPGLAGVLREMSAGLDIGIQHVVDTMDVVTSVIQSIGKFRPDILFLELDLPHALSLAEQLQSYSSNVKIVGISKDHAIVRPAREAGIDQVLITPFGEQEFFQTVRLSMSQQRADSAVFGFLPAKGMAPARPSRL